MIKTFRHRALAELWNRGTSPRIDSRLHERMLRRLEALDAAAVADDMAAPGFDFHALRGFRPVRYSVHVNGLWCITFEFEAGDAYRVDFEQYH